MASYANQSAAEAAGWRFYESNGSGEWRAERRVVTPTGQVRNGRQEGTVASQGVSVHEEMSLVSLDGLLAQCGGYDDFRVSRGFTDPSF